LISIAIPDSLFLEDDTLREKTVKVGLIARAAAIFGTERIYIFRDPKKNHETDYEIAKIIFEYAETPQYLRKRLYGRRKELEFAGLLPPLRIPSHLRDPAPAVNEEREAVIVFQNGEMMADVGARELASVEGRSQEGVRTTVKVLSTNPMRVSIIPRPTSVYWGYEIRRAPSLGRFLKSAHFDMTILTSRLGTSLEKSWTDFCSKLSTSERILVCFGPPDSGIDKLLKIENMKVSDFEAMYLNAFPHQNVETIRLEEAILGFLSILNIAVSL
jgi:predicted SPOUT superfamily RNA methylase MTH1